MSVRNKVRQRTSFYRFSVEFQGLSEAKRM